MLRKDSGVDVRILLQSAVLLMLAGSAWSANTGKLLHDFAGTPDGGYPQSDLIFDSQGNIFGTTYSGGTGGGCFGGCGTVFELTPDAGGRYTERVIYSFQGSPVDGQNPQAPLIFDSAGNLYGTTVSGGIAFGGSGTVFELSPGKNGTWTETVLHSFTGNQDGGNPQGGLIFDKKGNLYGTAAGGGTGVGCAGGILGCGVVFELTPSDGGWEETVLHDFTNNHSDGWNPEAGLISDAEGNLYSTTYYGGSEPMGGGTVFKLASTSDGWQESVLYSFACEADGCSPYSNLALDPAGNLYGATVGGGAADGFGVVFKLTPGSDGSYTQSVIHTFGSGNDGRYAYGNPILDSAGNLYGTTDLGGGGTNTACSNGCGTVYKLTPAAGGNYTETILARAGNGSAGGGPLAGLAIYGKPAALYGVLDFGGPGGVGTVFELVP
jgi:uncharacterized repeat protein (TIGR03803 family)